MLFCVFNTIKIQNGHCLNVRMKRAQNSDSETYVKKLNPTSRTEIGYKLLWCILLVHPVCICIWKASKLKISQRWIFYSLFPYAMINYLQFTFQCNEKQFTMYFPMQRVTIYRWSWLASHKSLQLRPTKKSFRFMPLAF